jgi:hypothetical protein
MNVFRTLMVPAGTESIAIAICNVLGYPDRGMFTRSLAPEGIPIAFGASGIVDDASAVLKPAAELHAALEAIQPGAVSLADCQAFVKVLDATEAEPFAQAATVIDEVAGKLAAPAWIQPTGPENAYGIGATVTYASKKWRSLVAGNLAAPALGAGWREHWPVKVPTPTPPAWVQPTGAHDAYPIGAVVSHKGKVWLNPTYAANVWEPGVFGWTEQSTLR